VPYLTIETPEQYVLFMKVVESSPTEALFILTSYVGSTTQWLGRLVRKDAAGWGVKSWNSVSGEAVVDAIEKQEEGSIKSHVFGDGGSYEIHVHCQQAGKMEARESFTLLENKCGPECRVTI
jgi:hypothetical protein